MLMAVAVVVQSSGPSCGIKMEAGNQHVWTTYRPPFSRDKKPKNNAASWTA